MNLSRPRGFVNVSKLIGGADELNLHPALINVVSDVVVPCVNVLVHLQCDRIDLLPPDLCKEATQPHTLAQCSDGGDVLGFTT
jgi:hypothetical protein